MRAEEVCKVDVACVLRDTSLTEAARLMRERHVGCVVVLDAPAPEHGRPIGMLTDRDIVVEIVAAGIDHRGITVGEIMTTPLITGEAGEDALAALRVMRLRGIRRLPLVDKDGFLVGIATLDDLLEIAGDAFYDIVGAISSERSLEGWRRP
jgi:CBS domain-containing protein